MDRRNCELQTLHQKLFLYINNLKYIVPVLIVLHPSPFQCTSDTCKMSLWGGRASNLITETLAWSYCCQLWSKRKNDLKGLLWRKDMSATTGKELYLWILNVGITRQNAYGQGGTYLGCFLPMISLLEDYWQPTCIEQNQILLLVVSFYLFLYQHFFLCHD